MGKLQVDGGELIVPVLGEAGLTPCPSAPTVFRPQQTPFRFQTPNNTPDPSMPHIWISTITGKLHIDIEGRESEQGSGLPGGNSLPTKLLRPKPKGQFWLQ